MYPFDQNNQQQYQQYAQASDSGDYSGIDQDQATGHVQQFAQNAPPAMQQQVYGQAFQQMPQDQREQFVQQLPPEAQGQMDPNDPQGMGQQLHQLDFGPFTPRSRRPRPEKRTRRLTNWPPQGRIQQLAHL